MVLISLLKTLFSLYRVSQMGSIRGGQSGQNGQKLHEIYKSTILEANSGGRQGVKPIFRVVGGSSQFLPTRGNPNASTWIVVTCVIVSQPSECKCLYCLWLIPPIDEKRSKLIIFNEEVTKILNSLLNLGDVLTTDRRCDEATVCHQT